MRIARENEETTESLKSLLFAFALSMVLIYLLLADRRVEIVADRGIHGKVGTAAWEAICGEMQQEFARGQFERGVVLGVRAISDLLVTHFPPSGEGRNELPDKPAVV